MKPRIVVHTTYFNRDERSEAQALGEQLYELLTRPRIDPLGWGAGVPVRIATHPDSVDVAEAKRVIVVAPLGQDLFTSEKGRKAAIAKLESWKANAFVIPLLRSEAWLDVESSLPVKPLRTEVGHEPPGREATIEEIVLAIARELSGGDQHKLHVFISHAKGDIPTSGKAAEAILEHIQTRTTADKPFFDKASLLAGEELDTQIDTAAERGVFIAVRGDIYSSREWCVRELLKAKERHLPLITVEVLTNGERRSSAYAGNAPTITWDRSAPDASALRVSRFAMVECIRHLLFREEARRVLELAALPSDAIATMARAPELLDLSGLRTEFAARELIILHPDPELSVHERKVLHDSHKDLRLITPTSVFAGTAGSALRAPLGGWQVALSLSNNPDTQRVDGIALDHIVDATVSLSRALIAAGAEIAYGGDFRNEESYTRLLIQLISAYKLTASHVDQALHSYIAAHLRRPDRWKLPHTVHHLGGDDSDQAKLPPLETAPNRAQAALYFNDMRRYMSLATQARVVLGGNVTPRKLVDDDGDRGYGGRYPGVLEEVWWTLKADKPLYVVGGFGGAAKLVVDLLDSDALPQALDETRWKDWPAWQALVQQFDSEPARTWLTGLEVPRTQAEMAAAVRALIRPRLATEAASQAWNGLSIAENRTLFAARDPLTIASLVLKGIVTMRTHASRDMLDIELVEGDIAAATGLDLLAVPTFANVPLDGAGAALDRVTGNAATRSRDTAQLVSPGPMLGARFLYAAPLGRADAVANPRKAVEAAADATIVMARRHGFVRIGLVTFLGNTAQSTAEVVDAMVDGLAGAKDMQLVWYERDPTRAAMIASALQTHANVQLTRIVQAAADAPAPVRVKQRTLLTLRSTGLAVDATLLVPEPNGLAPSLRVTIDDATRASLAGNVTGAPPSTDQLAQRGKSLAGLLFGADPKRVLEAIGDSELAILHDGPESALPYEAMALDGQEPPVLRGGVVRHLIASVDPESGIPAPAHAGKLGVLLVIDPTNNLPGAFDEGERIRKLLEQRPDRYALHVLARAAATVDAVRTRLADLESDVVHYCGHAFFDGPGPNQSGLQCADGTLTLAELRGLARVPRLAIFNACQSGRVRGATATAAIPLSFAEYFLQARVDAYLGTFWQVSDGGAASFAETLYERLASGDELGLAVLTARRRLAKDGCSDWANYMLYGRSSFRLVRGTGLPPSGPVEPPPAEGRIDGSTIVATWSFAAAHAPESFSLTLVERFASGVDQPTATARPIVVERRESSEAGVTLVRWIATIALAAPATGRAFRLVPTEGTPLELGDATPTRHAPHATRHGDDELRQLYTVLEQQPDRGREVLASLMPSADPDWLRAMIEQKVAPERAATRAIFPLNKIIDKPLVDEDALRRFVAASNCGPLDAKTVASDKFQTKEDWASYFGASGTASFMVGLPVNKPLSVGLTPDEMTYPVAKDELVDGGITVGLFSDNGNGLYSSLAIAKQVVDSNLPYAFHLGDVYYGGTEDEFRDYFATPLAPMLDRTELFMITGNHEMFARGEWYQQMVRGKAAKHPKRQRQKAETFRLTGPGFQIIGLDTMFVDWSSPHMRLHDYANAASLQLLDGWLAERPDDLTILLTTNEAWDRGNKKRTRLYNSLRETIAGRIDLWFWGNVHYAALYEAYAFPDVGARVRPMISSCIGHGGYPFYTQTDIGKLPDGVGCRWIERNARFWPEPAVRPDLGLNGWCTMKLARAEELGWNVEITYLDWLARERLRVRARRVDSRVGNRMRPGDIELVHVEESELANVGAKATWRVLT